MVELSTFFPADRCTITLYKQNDCNLFYVYCVPTDILDCGSSASLVRSDAARCSWIVVVVLELCLPLRFMIYTHSNIQTEEGGQIDTYV